MNSTPLATVADAIEFNRKRRQQIATTPLNRPRKMSAVVRKLSYRAVLITSENPGLREVDLEPSSKRGCSNK